MTWHARLVSAQRTQPAETRVVADGFIESYIRWLEACDDVRTAYARWTTGNSSQSRVAFEIYRAALDREELAADIHRDWTRRARALKR